MSKKLLKILYVFIVTTVILIKESYCYLDPSAMTYIIQVGATIVITLATSIGIFLHKIKKKFKNEEKNKIVEDDEILKK